MKEKFITKRFSDAQMAMLHQSALIIEDFLEDGIDLTLRQLYYRLFKGGHFPESWFDEEAGSTNNDKSYAKLKTLIGDARLSGIVDWDHIEDLERPLLSNPHWDNMNDFVMGAAPQYRIDLWANQPVRLECMVEKRGHIPIIQPICQQEDIAITGNKGYTSLHSIYKAGKRMKKALRDGKRGELIYFGDHDPSGIDMSRDIFDRINVFAGVISLKLVGKIIRDGLTVKEILEESGRPFVKVHRIALNIDQVRARDLIPAPAKVSDSRARDYIAKFGKECWEVEALDAREMRDLATETIVSLRNQEIWAKDVAKMNKDRKKLVAFAKTFK